MGEWAVLLDSGGVLAIFAGAFWLAKLQGRVDANDHRLDRQDRQIQRMAEVETQLLQTLSRLEGKLGNGRIT